MSENLSTKEAINLECKYAARTLVFSPLLCSAVIDTVHFFLQIKILVAQSIVNSDRNYRCVKFG
jgi:hypothetical protein